MIEINKPVIGITTFCKKEINKKNYNKVSCSYIRVISKAGGIPVLIPLMTKLEKAKDYIDLIDALVLSGGQDVSPCYYGENFTGLIENFDSVRDSWEIELFERAYNLNLPILGVCRGMQLINVARGGTLYQDIINQYDDSLLHLPSEDDKGYIYHKINIEQDNHLCDFACSQQIDVNSYHHQAIKDLAPGFKVIAKTEGEIIEAIEAVDKDFVVGLQWHPEDLTELHPCFSELFNILIEEAINKKS